MTTIAQELEDLAGNILNHLELLTNSQNSSANESHFERHIQNSNSDLHELEPAFAKARSGESEADQEAGAPRVDAALADPDPKRPDFGTPLPMVLEACPDILDYICAREEQGAQDTASRPPN